MRIITAQLAVASLLMLISGMVTTTPGRAFPVTYPTEQLAGLWPGISTLDDAVRLYGAYDIAMSGRVTGYAGGSLATKAYRWSPGPTYGSPGLVVETPIGSSQIITVMIDAYPGLGTSLGLTPLTSDLNAVKLYGLPDYVFKYQFEGFNSGLEMFYLREGLLVLATGVPSRPNWTITKIILTSPTYLQNAVAMNTRAALGERSRVEDFTNMYRVWAQQAAPPATDPARREDY